MPPPHIKRRAETPSATSKQHATVRHPEGAQVAHTGAQAWAVAAAAATAATAASPAVPTPTNQQKTGLGHSTNPPLNRNLVNQGGAAAGANSEAAAAIPGK